MDFIGPPLSAVQPYRTVGRLGMTIVVARDDKGQVSETAERRVAVVKEEPGW
jgi:hypothetical protein